MSKKTTRRGRLELRYSRFGVRDVNYGVLGVSQIKFTMSDPFLVLYDFDILSMIKRKNPLVFIAAFHFSNNNFETALGKHIPYPAAHPHFSLKHLCCLVRS